MSFTAEAPRLTTHVRHRPEQTLLYQLVERHYPEFARLMAAQGSPLPGYVAREFEDYLTCGRLEHGFLRVRCASCHHAKLVAFSCKRRGFCPSCGARHAPHHDEHPDIYLPVCRDERAPYCGSALCLRLSTLR